MPLDDGVRTARLADDSANARARARALFSNDPQVAVAWKYHETSLALRAAEVERTKAHAAAVKAGVLFDHLTNPEPVGTSRVVYADTAVAITVTVYAPIVGVDHAGYVADLLKAGVKPALIKRLERKHRTETRPAHKFTTSVVQPVSREERPVRPSGEERVERKASA